MVVKQTIIQFQILQYALTNALKITILINNYQRARIVRIDVYHVLDHLIHNVQFAQQTITYKTTHVVKLANLNFTEII